MCRLWLAGLSLAFALTTGHAVAQTTSTSNTSTTSTTTQSQQAGVDTDTQNDAQNESLKVCDHNQTPKKCQGLSP